MNMIILKNQFYFYAVLFHCLLDVLFEYLFLIHLNKTDKNSDDDSMNMHDKYVLDLPADVSPCALGCL